MTTEATIAPPVDVATVLVPPLDPRFPDGCTTDAYGAGLQPVPEDIRVPMAMKTRLLNGVWAFTVDDTTLYTYGLSCQGGIHIESRGSLVNIKTRYRGISLEVETRNASVKSALVLLAGRAENVDQMIGGVRAYEKERRFTFLNATASEIQQAIAPYLAQTPHLDAA